jgi:hypothetical protein
LGGGVPRGGKLPIVGSDNNTSTKMEGTVVKVAKAVSSLTVSDKGTVTTILGAAQTSLPLGQEGLVDGAPSTVLYGAAFGQEDRIVAAFVPANLGQEGLGLAGKVDTQLGVLHGQEGHACSGRMYLEAPKPLMPLLILNASLLARRARGGRFYFRTGSYCFSPVSWRLFQGQLLLTLRLLQMRAN